MNSTTNNRVAQIEARLRAELAIGDLLIKDQSHLHAGHAGAQDGGGHYQARIVSQDFDGLSRIQRHQRVYAILDDLMKHQIHALSLTTLTPDEA